MFRKDLIQILLGNPMTVNQIARLVDESPGRVADDLNHLLRSLKHLAPSCSQRYRNRIIYGGISKLSRVALEQSRRNLFPWTP